MIYCLFLLVAAMFAVNVAGLIILLDRLDKIVDILESRLPVEDDEDY